MASAAGKACRRATCCIAALQQLRAHGLGRSSLAGSALRRARRPRAAHGLDRLRRSWRWSCSCSSMQLLNDAGMLALLVLGRRSLAGFFNGFSYALELGSGATAVLVALIYNTMALDVLVLTLAVLSVGMLALRQFANMRHKLELIVAERTQKLEEKTRELELQATRDNLTGLFNRRYADEYLARRARDLPSASGGISRSRSPTSISSSASTTCTRMRPATRCCAASPRCCASAAARATCSRATAARNSCCASRAPSCARRASFARSCAPPSKSANWAQLGLAAGVTISFGIAEYRARHVARSGCSARPTCASTRRRTAAATSSSRSAEPRPARYDAHVRSGG